MDGTLTQTNQLIFASFNHVALKYAGTVLTPSEIIALFGPPEEGGLARVVGHGRLGAAMDDLCDYYRANHRRLAGLHEGMDGVLALLRGRGVKLALFTGKGHRTTAITLDELGLGGAFDLVVSGTDVVNHKPHPEGIARVLRELAVRPAETLMVGDTLADIRASHGAGIPVAAVLWDSFDRERVLHARPEYVFHTVRDLELWFRRTLN
jgi:HAD superfamily hydrolase (TIGR01509 family)